MFYIIRDILFIILAIIGLIDLVRMVALFFLRTESDKNMLFVIPIEGHNGEAEALLRHAAARVKWFGGGRFRKIVCLDCGMDAETRKICELVCKDYPFFEIQECILY